MSESIACPGGWPASWFNPDCRRCPRLAGFLEEVRYRHPGYHAAPVPPFGAPDAALVIVGLAPGMHGANRTGRPFTGDFAGILLYRSLHALGLADRPESVAADDGLVLRGCRITNTVKCLPPANKPAPGEIRNCRPWLAAELGEQPPRAILALGRIAHDGVLDALGLRRREHRFAHGAEHALTGHARLFDSYHCSRYNTQTRRLTPEMFMAVLSKAVWHAGLGPGR